MFILAIIHTLVLAYIAYKAITLYDDSCIDGTNRLHPKLYDKFIRKMKIMLAKVASAETVLLMLGGGLHTFDKVEFVKYSQYVIVLPYVVLGVASLISFLVFWVVRYAQKKRLARTTPDFNAIERALEGGHLSEAIRLYEAVNCLNETYVEDALRKVLKNLPIGNAIRIAARELLALQRDSVAALRVGAPQELVSKLTEESKNMLDIIWRITDRVVAVRIQNIYSSELQEELGIQEKKIKSLTSVINEARKDLAIWNLRGLESQDIEQALKNFRYFLVEYRDQMNSHNSI